MGRLNTVRQYCTKITYSKAFRVIIEIPVSAYARPTKTGLGVRHVACDTRRSNNSSVLVLSFIIEPQYVIFNNVAF